MPGFFRRRLLARHALDDGEWQRACARVPLIAGLDEPERERLRELVTLLLVRKRISASAGFALDAGQRIEIAVWAVLPVLRLGLGAYAGFHELIVYPDEFLAPRSEVDEAGVVHEGYEAVCGEAWEAGPILLSWADVEADRVLDGCSVVIHECAHKLDQRDGDMNGVPALAGTGIRAGEWEQGMRAAWEALGRAARARRPLPIDDYALESPAEFFAVLSEQFFTAPHVLHEALPEVHALLGRFYAQDPLGWDWDAVVRAHERLHGTGATGPGVG